MSPKKYVPIFAAFAVAAAAQIPQTMLFQGQLSQGGIAVNDRIPILVNLCDAASDNLAGCSKVYSDSTTVTNGYYAIQIPLPAMNKPYWLDVTANKMVAAARIPLSSAPYAINALVADSAGRATKADTATVATKLMAGATGNNLTLSGNITASTYSYYTPKPMIMEIPVQSLAPNPYQSDPLWVSAAWSFGYVCPTAGATIGKLTSSYILNIPDGAIIDSLITYADDANTSGLPINVYIDADNVDAGTEISIIDLGTPGVNNDQTSPKTEWTNVRSTLYRKASPLVTKGHVVDKSKYVYYFSVYAAGGTATCSLAGSFVFTLNRAYIKYHIASPL